MDRCSFCHAPIQQRRVEHLHRWAGSLYLLRNVPAEVCTQCGEVFLVPQTLKAMDKLVSEDRKPETILLVPVFSL